MALVSERVDRALLHSAVNWWQTTWARCVGPAEKLMIWYTKTSGRSQKAMVVHIEDKMA